MFVQCGDVLDYVNNTGAALANDAVVDLGTRIGVTGATIGIGETGPLSVTGVHKLPAVAAEAWPMGAALYWSGTELTAVGAGFTPAGWAAADKLAAATKANVKLDE